MRFLSGGGIGLFVLLALAPAARAQDLPKRMTWTSYDAGSQGYTEASAIADAFGRKYGTRVRIQPSGSSIGRLQPLLNGRASVGFLATETFFATEGVEDFANPKWGPQDLRTIAGRPGSIAMVTTQESGIDTIADMKGRRLALTVGNASINVKCAALLAFAGLSLDDIEPVYFPTYSSSQSSLNSGEADATCGATTSSAMYELEASRRGIKWLSVPAENTEGWEQLTKVAPFFSPFYETSGAGLSEDNPVQIVGLRYPIIVVRAEMDDDVVYALTKALDETFGLYENATTVTERWSLDGAGTPPIDAPFHNGAIRYLREIGVWNDQHQSWNDARLARLNTLKDAWITYKAANEKLDREPFVEGWMAKRSELLANF
ncbi:TAXI family TRAP transporter solute-binding subunit [Amorphus sp. 3PC139-8]|uniref:TAXI family TRAP transporter solute-binding subunit n=1 Tax=Amorphus sp. 3PC139-8 TaxID=2735676 RepID=UPI00345C671C